MGRVTAKLSLTNPRDPALEPIEVRAVGDTGSVFLCIPEHVRLQLKLEVPETREVELSDGSCRTYPYVGPIIGASRTARAFWARSSSATRCCSAPFRWRRWISSSTRVMAPSM